MFLGFAQFGKQSKNSKTNSKKQARKSNEINMNKSLKNHETSLQKPWKKPLKNRCEKKMKKKDTPAESGTLAVVPGGTTIQQDILRIGTILGKKLNYN